MPISSRWHIRHRVERVRRMVAIIAFLRYWDSYALEEDQQCMYANGRITIGVCFVAAMSLPPLTPPRIRDVSITSSLHMVQLSREHHFSVVNALNEQPEIPRPRFVERHTRLECPAHSVPRSERRTCRTVRRKPSRLLPTSTHISRRSFECVPEANHSRAWLAFVSWKTCSCSSTSASNPSPPPCRAPRSSLGVSRCAACLARLRLERVPLPPTQTRRRRGPPARAPLADLAVQWAHARVVGPRADV
jgi:hypothetical protein